MTANLKLTTTNFVNGHRTPLTSWTGHGIKDPRQVPVLVQQGTIQVEMVNIILIYFSSCLCVKNRPTMCE